MVLKILHLHRPPHAPLPGPTLQAGQLLLRHLCKVVALSWWPAGLGDLQRH